MKMKSLNWTLLSSTTPFEEIFSTSALFIISTVSDRVQQIPKLEERSVVPVPRFVLKRVPVVLVSVMVKVLCSVVEELLSVPNLEISAPSSRGKLFRWACEWH